jgi:hypothetical protein
VKFLSFRPSARRLLLLLLLLFFVGNRQRSNLPTLANGIFFPVSFLADGSERDTLPLFQNPANDYLPKKTKNKTTKSHQLLDRPNNQSQFTGTMKDRKGESSKVDQLFRRPLFNLFSLAILIIALVQFIIIIFLISNDTNFNIFLIHVLIPYLNISSS